MNRLTEDRVKVAENGFRSVIDRRLGPIEQNVRAVPALQGELASLRSEIGRLTGYFTQAQEADLDPQERQERQRAREQQAQQTEQQRQYQQAAFIARQQNAAWKVMTVLPDFGLKWLDERIDWSGQLYDTDPDSWASTVMANAARWYGQELRTTAQQRAAGVDDVNRDRSRSVAEREATDRRNQSREEQARVAEPSLPGGTQAGWLEKVKQLTPQERRDWIRSKQRQIGHQEIQFPWE